MSYRRDADVSRPYGKIIRLDKSITRNYSEVFRQKTTFGVWMSSHCPVPSRRKEYIEKLQKYIDIDTFGSCGKKKCGVRNPAMNECLKNFSRDYKFYFSFENNVCRDYSTEKVFNLYEYNLSIIPVEIYGPPQAGEYLPKGTFINALDYTSPETLAKALKEIGSSEKLYTQYLKEKDEYCSLNKHEIFRDSMCSVCKTLVQQEDKKILTKPKVIDMFKTEC
ncbi:glycoprotein 3-alpha-L-fucosyltransferase A-like [Crassostrea angulata]|uniref:glycoprotein 3-alpha-L-fucosyltransferase A-like n=1 Tax=Magallana angulata TaxID=2784310 RepID=UPI0022B14E43|nr:glycoprotein 3-alpha-L-fucosyltransferase A-like [Crassostrea angulata]